MKNFIILFFMIFIINRVWSIDHYVKESSIDCNNSQIVYSGPQAKEVCGNDCFIVDPVPFNCKFSKVVNEYWDKKSVVSCTGTGDCQDKLEIQNCDEGYNSIKNLDLMQVYCAKFISKHIGIDEAKKTIYDQELAQSNAQQMAIDQAKKLMEYGKEVIAFIAVQNVSKNLSTEQVKSMVSTYSSIKQLLESGALASAKEETLKIIPDGVIIRQVDLSQIVAKIDYYLGL